MDLDKFRFTILAGYKIEESYRTFCEKSKINVVELPKRKTQTIRFYGKLFQNLRGKKYDIVHVHGSNASIAVELFLAFLSGIRVRIAHSHNTTCLNMKAHKLMRPFFNKLYTTGFACGYDAGKWLFGKKDFDRIRNGFCVEKFVFNESIRNNLKKEMKLEDKFVIGHVGRFNSQKNQEFIVEVFEKIRNKREDAVLLLVGDGPDFFEISKMVVQSKYKDSIILYGETLTPEMMYMVMDVFLFPSKFEGMPITLIEAQISGLPCVVSSNITKEVQISENIYFLLLADNSDIWADTVSDIPLPNRRNFYFENFSSIEKYSIKICAKYLEKKYVEILG